MTGRLLFYGVGGINEWLVWPKETDPFVVKGETRDEEGLNGKREFCRARLKKLARHYNKREQ